MYVHEAFGKSLAAHRGLKVEKKNVENLLELSACLKVKSRQYCLTLIQNGLEIAWKHQ